MSNALAIATVTHVMSTLLKEGITQNNVDAFLKSGNAAVSTRSPGVLAGNDGKVPAQLNLFLYRVSHNTGWNNSAYPSRNSSGDEIRSVPLAINLHYLLTAFGEDELDSEILLGFGMQILHEHPVLYRKLITDSLSNALLALYTGSLQSAIKLSGLADQVELIKVTPESINTEEMSRLWSAFQTKYHTCTGYQVTVVLIEKEKALKSGLPVKERLIKVQPFRYPSLQRVLSQSPLGEKPSEFRRIHLGDRLFLEGNQLSAATAALTLNDRIISTESHTDTNIECILSQAPPADPQIRAGLQTLKVIQSLRVGKAPDEHDTPWAASNVLPFMLSPKILQTNLLNGPTRARIQTDIKIASDQRVVLLLNELGNTPNPTMHSFVRPKQTPGPDTDQVEFTLSGVGAGKYAVRIQVDGAESPFEGLPTDANGPQILNIP